LRDQRIRVFLQQETSRERIWLFSCEPIMASPILEQPNTACAGRQRVEIAKDMATNLKVAHMQGEKGR
jgi:hypothetical protein